MQREVDLLSKASKLCDKVVRLLGVSIKQCDGVDHLAIVMKYYPTSLIDYMEKQPGKLRLSCMHVRRGCMAYGICMHACALAGRGSIAVCRRPTWT